jgi:ADP-ribose pyrophosphatase YjhB (NUDIX family)
MASRDQNPPNATAKPAGPREWKVPPGDDRARLTCADCGFVHYDNPKVVVGAVVTHGEKILLCRRAIAPRIGFWTLPAGYLELHETTEAGAAREAWEEARAKIAIGDLFAVYNVPRISQVQMFYRAVLEDPAIAAGPESQAVALFSWDTMPWDDLAFPTTRWALKHFREIEGLDRFAVRGNPPGDLGVLTSR